MQMTQVQPGSQATQRYHISSKVMWPRILMIVGILAGVPVLMKLVGEDVDALVFVIFGILIAVCLLVIWWALRVTWIQMDANGIVYKGIGFRVVSSWDNVAAIGSRFMLNEGNVEGLLLTENSLDMHGALKAGSWFSWQSAVTMQAMQNFIPLSNFQTKEWRDTRFGQDIRRYAPRLFKAENWG
jgi:hypothetical protein